MIEAQVEKRLFRAQMKLQYTELDKDVETVP
jgi:hypothetical protein